VSARLRLLVATALITSAALGGAIYVERSPVHSGDFADASQNGTMADLNLSMLAASDATPDGHMLAFTYEHVQHAFYKPVNDRVLLSGERNALLKFLQARHVAHPHLPLVTATGNERHDLSALEDEVHSAFQRYPHAASRDEYTEVAITGMLNSLEDPYTVYMTPAEIKGLNEILDGGQFGGVGIYLGLNPKTGAVIADPIEGNPAIRAGVHPGDIIISVDNVSTLGQKLETVEHLIRGPLGTTVTLHLKDPQTLVERTVHVTRAEIHVPSVLAKMENGIDYIRLADFGKTSADEVRAAVLSGERQHARGYILDLRNNGGGYLDAAVEVSSIFIPQGTIVSTITRDGDRQSQSATGNAIDASPLVVLVNENTASSSEITSGALQDYQRGTLVGTRTFGKGVVQKLWGLPDNGALKMTVARYVTPLGRDIHHKGILPDVVVKQRSDIPIIDTPRDRQLAAAKAIIAQKDHQ
jgi:carboxyl-terminal processing protease